MASQRVFHLLDSKYFGPPTLIYALQPVLLLIKERVQPSGHHQSQRYMAYKRVDVSEWPFLRRESLQRAECQAYAMQGPGKVRPDALKLLLIRHPIHLDVHAQRFASQI